MKFVSFTHNQQIHSGLLVNQNLFPLNVINPKIPADMASLLANWETNQILCKEIETQILNGQHTTFAIAYNENEVLSPVPSPTSCRDGYAFRQHVAAARRNRGVEMIKEFDSYPIFYFTNHNAIQGPGPILCMPDHFDKLDFELEIAIVVGKKGRNIPASKADEYIAGYMIMNDMSARTLQMEEMLLNLGPAKGKDFSTVIGPYFVTPDELAHAIVPAKENHIGNNHRLNMQCKVNGIQVSFGNVADMDWTFAEILERCSYGVDILPGDVIGSGTVGTGCFLELNGTAKLNNPNAEAQWLKNGDVVEMEIEGLGVLRNTIVAENTNWSILALKK